MNWAWPQVTMIALLLIETGYALARHGQPRDDYNFLNFLVSMCIWGTLLYYGGFFAVPA